MSGWVAVLSTSAGAPARADQATSLAETFACLRGPSESSVLTAGQFGHVVALNRRGEAPRVQESTGGWVAWSGHPVANLPMVEASPQDVDGQWSLIKYDRDRDAVVAATDPFGMSGVYLARRGDWTYLSTSSLVLAAHLRLPADPRSVREFLRIGYQFGATTMWSGLQRLLPGELVQVSSDAVTTTTYWRPVLDPRTTKLPMRATAERLAHVLVRDAARLRGASAYADLTGGFDSRTLTLALDRSGVAFATSTNGEVGDPDVEIAQEIAAMKGWEWRRIGPPPDWSQRVRPLLGRALAWGDAQLDVLQLSDTLCGHDLKQESGPTGVLFAGGGIEHFRHYAWYSEFLHAGRNRSVDVDRWVALLAVRPMDVSFFASDPTEEVKRSVADRLRERIAPYGRELNTVQADLMYAYKSVGHFGAYANAGAGHFDVVLPGYFKDVFTVAFSASHRHRNAHRLNREVLDVLDPEAARIRAAIGGPATPMRRANAWRFWPYYVTFARKAVNKFGGLAGLNVLPPIPTNRGFVTGRAVSRAIAVSALLEEAGSVDELRAASILEPRGAAAVIDRARAGDPTADLPLGRILTVEMALRAADARL